MPLLTPTVCTLLTRFTLHLCFLNLKGVCTIWNERQCACSLYLLAAATYSVLVLGIVKVFVHWWKRLSPLMKVAFPTDESGFLHWWNQLSSLMKVAFSTTESSFSPPMKAAFSTDEGGCTVAKMFGYLKSVASVWTAVMIKIVYTRFNNFSYTCFMNHHIHRMLCINWSHL